MQENETLLQPSRLNWSYLENKGVAESTDKDKQLRKEIFEVLKIGFDQYLESHQELGLMQDELQTLAVILIDLIFDFLKTSQLTDIPIFAVKEIREAGGEFKEVEGGLVINLSADYLIGSLLALREFSQTDSPDKHHSKYLSRFLYFTVHELGHFRQKKNKPELIEEALQILSADYPDEDSRKRAYYLTPAETNAQSLAIRFVKAEQNSQGSLRIWKELKFDEIINTSLADIVESRRQKDALKINELLHQDGSLFIRIRRKILGDNKSDKQRQKKLNSLISREIKQRDFLAEVYKK